MITFSALIVRCPGYDPKTLARRLRYRGYRSLPPSERGQYCTIAGADFKLRLYRDEIAFEGDIAACWAALEEVGSVEVSDPFSTN